jgi:DNA mismatch endonuclease, patch repair protein
MLIYINRYQIGLYFQGDFMADRVSKEDRSKIMKSIRSVSKLEDIICKELWRRGIRFRRNVKSLYGNPDIAIKKYKVVIFIDSCFWHFCPDHGHIPKSNFNYWTVKLQKNKNRDRKVNEYYISQGWNLMRIWEHEIKTDLSKVVDDITKFIARAKKN